MNPSMATKNGLHFMNRVFLRKPSNKKNQQQQQQKQNKELWSHKANSLRELRFPAEMSFSNVTVLHQEEG